MKLESGAVIGGKYKLERLLARGGMGSVWTAQHEKLDSRVAIKFMDPELTESTEARSRFEREAKSAARLRSPHVVQVLDYGVEEETPYIVMEHLAGEDLRSRLKTRFKLNLDEASVILRQACKALRLAAEAGIVHRDLKPGNIFLARSGVDEVVKILDFGVAKALRANIGDGTSTGMLLGSPHYMSPEQSRGLELDPRSDLFSMAVILFQMITGERPFQGSDVGDVIVKICTEPLPLASSLRPDLPPEVDQFFERAMARNRAKRFQSAQALAAEFATIVAAHLGQPLPESSSGSLEMPRLPLPETDSGSLTPPLSSSSPVGTPQAAVLGAPSSEPSAATPSETMRSQAHLRLDPAAKLGTLTLATKSLSLRKSKSSMAAVWAALGAAVVAGGLVYLLVGRGPSVDPAGAAGTTESSAETGPDASTPAATSSDPVVEPNEPAQSASATTSAEPTATAATAAPPATPAPEPAQPRWRPKPKSSPPKPKPTGKHPVFGI